MHFSFVLTVFFLILATIVRDEGVSLADDICNVYPGLEFRQKIYLSDGQVDLQNHLSVMKSTCPTQENQKN